MMRYLDPKNDITFKRVFGEHPKLLKNFLNSIMPFDDGVWIDELEYLPLELLPESILQKQSIVDVRCIDNHKRQFIVEMQMIFTQAFFSRVLFNAAKIFSRQLSRGEKYLKLAPVYSLNIVNDDKEFFFYPASWSFRDFHPGLKAFILQIFSSFQAFQ